MFIRLTEVETGSKLLVHVEAITAIVEPPSGSPDACNDIGCAIGMTDREPVIVKEAFRQVRESIDAAAERRQHAVIQDVGERVSEVLADYFTK